MPTWTQEPYTPAPSFRGLEVPQGLGGCMSLGTVRHHLLGPHDLDNQCLLVSVLGISLTPATELSSPVQYPSHVDKRQVPKGPDGLPHPGQPETQPLSRWLKDFSSHTTLSRVGRGGGPLASL